NDARKYGARLRNALEGEAGGPDADMLRRASKRLHHAALLANQEAVLHAAAVLQKTAVQLLAGKRSWTTELAGQIETVLLDLDT
ncbi:MAG: hypothetical protein GWN71_17350, partial [Gammaproteobacteria bacterium]|nr:hypothetical protein [Gemmatimonadota bacterium]NIU75276.1 hypothetical protein [Gammaproteobacteria bacterium]